MSTTPYHSVAVLRMENGVNARTEYTLCLRRRHTYGSL